MKNEQKHVVVIGGGFAGVNIAKSLSADDEYRITVVDKNNYNFFPPLLYQVSTAFLDVSSISYPFRKLFRNKKNIRFRLGELKEIIPSDNKILLSSGEMHYDYLILATGTETNYFGMENIRKHALPMKTINDATSLRNHLLQCIEEATYTCDEQEKKKLTTIVVAGGGPTGVEIAGMIAEMKKVLGKKEYPELNDYHENEIYLIDGSPALLSPMSEQSQRYTYDALAKMGVKIKLNTRIKAYVNEEVLFGDNESIATKNLIWAAGVTAKKVSGLPNESYGRGNRLLVNQYNRLLQVENIYAIGDTCLQTTDKAYPNGHPQVAQVAIQQGKNLAINFKNLADYEPLTPFAYFDKGSMAIIGINKAVVDMPKPKLHLQGFIAWLSWLGIHLFYLVNYRNRIKTFYNWMVAYFTKDNSLRLIVRPASDTV